MNPYRCYHYLCRETSCVVLAATAYEARKAFAKRLGVHVTDIIAQRLRDNSVADVLYRTQSAFISPQFP